MHRGRSRGRGSRLNNGSNRSFQDRRGPRDGSYKPDQGDNIRNLDDDWVHDRFDEFGNDSETPSRGPVGFPPRRLVRRAPPAERAEPGTRLKVTNLHWEITEPEVQELFERHGPVVKCQMLYKNDRSTGVAFVTYRYPEDAKEAIKTFNGANALGQPITVQLADAFPTSNPSMITQPSGRSLFDRVDNPMAQQRDRSRSPPRYREGRTDDSSRRSNVNRPPPKHIDRYVPVEGTERDTRYESTRHNTANSRGNGNRHTGNARRGVAHDDSHSTGRSRPRKTKEELEAELNHDLDDYFKDKAAVDEPNNGAHAHRVGQDAYAEYQEDSTFENSGWAPADKDGDIEMG